MLMLPEMNCKGWLMAEQVSQWLQLSQVAEMVQGQLQGEDKCISSLSTDTRNLHQGDLFVALEGDRFDGHAFINKDIESLAVGVLVHKQVDTTLPSITVDDTLKGLSRWAQAWRHVVAPKLAAITGSNGKTTVKQMLSNVLSLAGSTCYTQGNLNNHIGVPLTLLTLREYHEYAVIEMGANHFGEINHLSCLAEPDIAIITNAGPAHLEGFGSVEGVSRAKGEIMNGLGEAGVIVLNADDQYLDAWLSMARDRNLTVVTFGFNDKADVKGVAHNGNHLAIKIGSQTIEVNLPLPGKHNACNALGVAAVAYQLNIDLALIKQGLESAHHVQGRLQTKQGLAGSIILDDTYNANPGSLSAAIEVLCAQPKEPWLVIGDMGELGEEAEQIHAQIGIKAKSAGVKKLFALGELSKHAVNSFGHQASHFDEHNQLSEALLAQLNDNCCVLVKGSRAMHMEDVVDSLVERAGRH